MRVHLHRSDRSTNFGPPQGATVMSSRSLSAPPRIWVDRFFLLEVDFRMMLDAQRSEGAAESRVPPPEATVGS